MSDGLLYPSFGWCEVDFDITVEADLGLAGINDDRLVQFVDDFLEIVRIVSVRIPRPSRR